MKTYTEAITDLRDLCLLINRKTQLNNVGYAERFGTSERHQSRQRRVLKALGADLRLCRGRDGYSIANDVHFGFGASHVPATAVADARYLATLPEMQKGDLDFPVALFNRLRLLAQMHLIILNGTKGKVRHHSARLGITEKKWYINLLILQNLGAEFKYDLEAGGYVYLNDFWIGLRVDQGEAQRAAATFSLPGYRAVRWSAAS